MLRLCCLLLLRAFPRHVRDRVGRPLVQTMIADARTASGRRSWVRLVANSIDVIRAGMAERMRPSESRRDSAAAPHRDGAGTSMLADLRHARRSLAGRPAFTFTVFTTLALGLGLNTAVFSIVHGVLVTELPYRDPSRLAFMWTKLAWIGVPRAWVAGPHIDRLQHDTSTIEEIVPLRTTEAQLAGGGAPELVRAGLTSARLFDVLGVRALHGRTFVQDDEPRNVVILGHALWAQRYGADPAAIGRTIEIAGDATEIVGVLPPDFEFLVHSSLGGPRGVDLWLPVQWRLAEMSDTSMSFAALVRVRPPYTVAQAQTELDGIGARIDRERFKSRGFGWQLVGVQDDLVAVTRPALLLIFGASALVLLVVAANVAGLLLMRHADRRREFAVRAALGAGRAALVRLVVVECVALSVAAGLAGLLLAMGFLRAAAGTLPVPRMNEVGVDGSVLAFSFLLALATGLAASAIPAWRSAHHGVSGSLAEAARGSSGRASRLRGVLVGAELALALVLMCGGALLVRSYLLVRAVDPGFDGVGTVTADVQLLTQRYPQGAQAIDFFQRLTDRLATLPGVSAVGAASSPPLDSNADQDNIQPAGWVPEPGGPASILVDLIRSTPGYFPAMGIPLIAGRDFTWADGTGSQPVAIVDEVLARQAWPNGQAVGRTLKQGDATITVVGVARHARQYQLERDDRPQVYRPYSQDTLAGLIVAVRTTGEPSHLPDAIRRVVWSLDDRQPVGEVVTMRAAVDATLAGRRLQLESILAFAIGAAVLAGLGLYGLLASLVGERRREIGIRMALGADRASVRRMIFGRIAIITGAGVAVGLIGALAMSRVIAPLLFGISPHDPGAIAATLGGLALLIAATSYPPIRRATAVDPADALRSE